MTKKSSRATSGSIVRIPLGDGTHTYGRALTATFVVVYDLRTTDEIEDLHRIISAPVLFSVGVYKTALRAGSGWDRVGWIPLAAHERVLPDEYTQDITDPTNIVIISSDVDGNWTQRRGTLEECERLEKASVWEREHVEERLRDHYAGRQNIELLAGQLVYPGQVFSKWKTRESSDPDLWIVSGRVHDRISVGDKLSTAQHVAPTLTVAKIESYTQEGSFEKVSAGATVTLHLTGGGEGARESAGLFRAAQ